MPIPHTIHHRCNRRKEETLIKKANTVLLGCILTAGTFCSFPVSAAVAEEILVDESVEPEMEEILMDESVTSEGKELLMDESVTSEREEIVVQEEKDGIPVDEAHFPDKLFRSYVSEKFDHDQDRALSETEIQNATTLHLSNKQITDLRGIGIFTMLTDLSLDTSVSTYDLSANEKLEQLYIEAYQPITSLDLSQCSSLLDLNVSNSKYNHTHPWNSDNYHWNLEGVIWPEENHIQRMTFESVCLAELAFPDFPYLTHLTMERPEVDLSCFPNLETLYLTALSHEGVAECPPLDVSKNPKLKRLNSQFAIPPCDRLDFSHNPDLEEALLNTPNYLTQTPSYDFDYTPIDELGWGDRTCEVILNQNIKLTRLYLYKIPVSAIHLEESPELKELMLGYTNIENLDLSQNQKLEQVFINQNANSFLHLDGLSLKQYKIQSFPTLKINKNHSYDLSKLPGYRKGMIKSARIGTLKENSLYPSSTEVECQVYLDSSKKYEGTVYFQIEGQLAPQPTTGLTLKKRTAASLTFQWKKTSDADGYRVYLKNKKTGVIEQRKSVSKKTNSFTFSKLKPATSYTVIVRGYKTYYQGGFYCYERKNYYSGYGQSSNTRTFTTRSR